MKMHIVITEMAKVIAEQEKALAEMEKELGMYKNLCQHYQKMEAAKNENN